MNSIPVNNVSVNSVSVNNVSVDNVSVDNNMFIDTETIIPSTPTEPPIIMLQPIARYSTKGKTNQDVDRHILDDLTGNGHDISLKNFAYSQMSGYGGYVFNFTNFSIPEIRVVLTLFTNSKIVISQMKLVNFPFMYTTGIRAQSGAPEIRVIITGLTPENPEIRYSYVKTVNGIQKRLDFNFTKGDGEYTLPESEGVTVDKQNYGWNGFFANVIKSDFNCTIEQIPLYPDGLCFDGIDDYGINDNQPILTDYTVIAKRIILDNTTNAAFLSKWYNGPVGNEAPSFGAYIIDRMVNKTDWSIYSFGARTALATEAIPPLIVTQSLRTYNGLQIPKGNFADTKWLILGATAVRNEQGSVVDYMKCVVYDILIYDKTLTPEEIESESIKYGLVEDIPVIEQPYLLSEDGKRIITEDNKQIITE